MLRVLDIFSGIGGFSLGLERTGGFKTVAFCEIEPYCRAVLKKHWPEIRCHEDVRTIPRIGCDVIVGGFPCQPVSRAGKQGGREDNRWLWPEMVRVIGEEQPDWVVCENVPGIIELELDQVLADLEDQGYSWWPFVVPACAVGAWHRRDRVWIVAHSERNKQPREKSCHGSSGRVGRFEQSVAWDRDWEGALREFRGVDDGRSYGVDRTDSIRNSIVPQIAEEIGRAILESEGMK